LQTDTSHWHAPSVPKLEAFYSDGHQFLRSGGGYAHHRPSSRQMWLLHCGCRPCALCSTSTSTSERDRKPLRTRDGMLCRPDQVGDPQLRLILFLRPSAPHTPLRIFLRWARYIRWQDALVSLHLPRSKGLTVTSSLRIRSLTSGARNANGSDRRLRSQTLTPGRARCTEFRERAPEERRST
jgi:hypothetical protein